MKIFNYCLLLIIYLLIVGCKSKTSKITNSQKEKEIIGIDIYCWCFNLNYFKYKKENNDSIQSLENFQLCHSPTNILPKNLAITENYKGNIKNKKAINFFNNTFTTKGKKGSPKSQIDARLLFVIEYKNSFLRDTLVYINGNYSWSNGYYIEYDNNVDSMLNVICGDLITTCSSKKEEGIPPQKPTD